MKTWIDMLGGFVIERIPPLANVGAEVVGVALVAVGLGLLVLLVVWLALAAAGERRAARTATKAMLTVFLDTLGNGPISGAKAAGRTLRDLRENIFGGGAERDQLEAAFTDALWRSVRAMRRRTRGRLRKRLDRFLTAAAGQALSHEEIIEAGLGAPERCAAAFRAKLSTVTDADEFLTDAWGGEKAPGLIDLYPTLLSRPEMFQALEPSALGHIIDEVGAIRGDVGGVRREVEKVVAWMPSLRIITGYQGLADDRVDRLPTALLISDYGVIPFDDSRALLGAIGDGRDETLLGWATSGDGVNTRLYVAAGGQGKTRLAFEAISKLHDAGGWRAGLLTRQTLDEALKKPDRGGPSPLEGELAQRGDNGFFLAIDYAETRIEQMKQLAAVLANAPSGGPIRVVLLARTDGWWAGFLKRLSHAEEMCFEREPMTRVAADIAPEHRTPFFERACAEFARCLAGADDTGAKRAQNQGREHTPLLDREWREKRWDPAAVGASGSPLFLAFQAFLHVRGQGVTKSPLAEMTREEQRHITRALHKSEDAVVVGLATRAAGVLTLIQGLTQNQGQTAFRALVRFVVRDADYPSDSDQADAARDALREALSSLYGVREREGESIDAWRPIQPDLLGERFVGEVLAARPGLLAAVLDRFPEVQDRQAALTVVNRITRRGEGGAAVHDEAHIVAPVRAALRALLPDRLEELAVPFLAAALTDVGLIQDDGGAALDALAADDRAAPAGRAIMAAGAALVDVNATPVRLRAFLGQAAGAAGASNPSPDLAEDAESLDRRARELGTSATFLSNAGQRAEALAAAEEAVKLHRALAADNPDAFTPDLATSIHNYANMLSDVGRRAEALATAEEAVKLRRALAADNPDAFTPDLAASINNYANRLAETGRRAEALAAAEEAVKLRRILAADNPDAFTPDLAASIHNYANRLSEAGRRAEALATAEEAVELRRALAADNPDAFTPDLAASINNYAGRLSEAGQRAEALAAAEEAVKLYRTLAADNPDAFTPNLAMSISNYAKRLLEAGQPAAALAAAEDAVKLYRTLAAGTPDAFTPDIARSLGSWGSVLNATGHSDAAADAFLEAAQLLQPLVETRAGALGDLFQALVRDFNAACHAAGRPDSDIKSTLDTLGVKLEDKAGAAGQFNEWAEAHNQERGEDASVAYAALVATLDGGLDDETLDPIRDMTLKVLAETGGAYTPAPARPDRESDTPSSA